MFVKTVQMTSKLVLRKTPERSSLVYYKFRKIRIDTVLDTE